MNPQEIKEYEPFGEEWKKEMNKFQKAELIGLLATANKARVKLQTKLQSIINIIRE